MSSLTHAPTPGNPTLLVDPAALEAHAAATLADWARTEDGWHLRAEPRTYPGDLPEVADEDRAWHASRQEGGWIEGEANPHDINLRTVSALRHRLDEMAADEIPDEVVDAWARERGWVD